uniref:Uncharacterized protein n=1 Tax=Panagrolaimus sp. JU765 TaxID=591449 RepID=A0AC34QPF6_9BILA
MIKFGGSKSSNSKNITNITRFLKLVEIVEIMILPFIMYSEFGLSSSSKDLWWKAMESARKLTLHIVAETSVIIKDIVLELNNTNEKNPLKKLQIRLKRISKDDLKYLLKNCIFANSASIKLHYGQECFKDAIEGIGKFEISVDKFNRTVYTIKTGVKIIKGPDDDNVGIKISSN